MLGKMETVHEKRNQENYSVKAKDHDTLSLDSTLYLAYRDLNKLLQRHLYPKLTEGKIRFLDFGCGVGLSTQMILQDLHKHSHYAVEAVGVDVNEANLEIARSKLTNVHFKRISTQDKLEDIGQFDLILCNFVLVEMKSSDMLDVLAKLKNRLTKDGVLIVTNPTARAYRPGAEWFTFNNQFPENTPTRKSDAHEKMKYHEDQPIKVQVFANSTRDKSFTFFDYFHSGEGYRNAYKAAGLQLLETHKPVGCPEDHIQWKAEESTPPYKIHVLV